MRTKDLKKISRLALVCGLLVPGIGVADARAALFCAQSANGVSECVFDDAQACRTRATEMGGGCTVNRAEILDVAFGTSPVCLVYSASTIHCLYADFTTCNRAARLNNAACVNLSSVQVFEETRGGAIDSQNRTEVPPSPHGALNRRGP